MVDSMRINSAKLVNFPEREPTATYYSENLNRSEKNAIFVVLNMKSERRAHCRLLYKDTII